MGIGIRGTTFLLKGRFDAGTKAEVQQQIIAAGGKVSKSMTLKTNFVVCGAINEFDLGYITNEAAAKGIPFLDEAQLLRLMAGQEIELVAPIEKPALQGSALGDAFTRVQALCREPLTAEGWHQICLELDQCDVEAQAVGADWVMEHLQGHVVERTLHERSRDQGATVDHTPCLQPSLRWITETLRGEDHPKFRIVRDLTLFGKKLTGKSAAPILECKNLCNVEILNLGGNKLPARFWKKFAEAPQFGAIKELWLAWSAFDQNTALALGQSGAFPNVGVLDLSFGTAGQGVMTGLLGQGAFKALRTLNLIGVQIGIPEIDAIVAASLPGLKTLRIGSYGIDEQALTTTLLRATHLDLDELELGVGINPTGQQLAALRAAPHFAHTAIRT